jgi:hypothetical protein
MFLAAGKDITQKGDKLYTITPEQLYTGISKAKPEIVDKIKQLRTIQNISTEQYRRMKVHLPYVVAASFNPPQRLTQNFAYTQHFILDIDHIDQKERDIDALKAELKADLRVKLMFISPGGNGLKLLFELSEKCYDSGKYSLFYKIFAEKFAVQYALEQVVDKKTSDVTRACFISHDEDAYLNLNCFPVIMSDYVDFEQVYEARKLEKKYEKIENLQETEKPEILNPIDDDKLLEIKKKLNPNISLKKEKQIYVPPELDEAIKQVEELMHANKIEIVEIVNIHYGKKFNFLLDKRKAEINLFYGKKGFTVVISPKTGTNAEFNEICYRLLCQIFYG